MVKALVIVAHPDDETIWMGGKILREKDWGWVVLSLCRKDDPDRAPKFFRVMEKLNARGFMSDLEDDQPEQPLEDIDEVVRRIEPVVDDKKFDVVYTHAPNGEYGHNRHKETNRAVHLMIDDGLLECNELFEFDYVRRENPFRTEPNPKANIKFTLTPQEFEKKRYLINEVYGFRKDSFEYISCHGIEPFRKVK